MDKLANIKNFDPEIFDAIKKEETRQKYKLELIASENYVSPGVLEATGSIFTNKYAEGYPKKRYYGGCENVDTIETLAINRAKELFDAKAANVQAHSGSQANMAAFLALINSGDKIMGMNLSHGGHLTHGASVNFSGFLFNPVFYEVEANGYIDYDKVYDLAKKEKPKLIISGFSAYSRFMDFEKFRYIADSIDAFLVADIAHVAGLVVGGQYPNPYKHCHLVTTTTHKTLRGPRGGLILGSEELIKKVNSKIFPGIQGGPLCHIIAAKAISFKEALQPEFKDYAKNVVSNAKVLADELIKKGYNIVSNGTDCHLMLIDLTKNNITGKEAEKCLDLAGITVNKNTVPNETKSPFVTSGIRIGTAALTTRGFNNNDMISVALFIDQAIKSYNQPEILSSIAKKVYDFAGSFPIFKT